MTEGKGERLYSVILMLFISEGEKFFCTRENNFMSGAKKADWSEWEVRKWGVSTTS